MSKRLARFEINVIWYPTGNAKSKQNSVVAIPKKIVRNSKT
ncbi:hypothetical protein PRO82_000136 [Candidatus Protochlamydia amoebophila]|nr:hypothetical protein [Candidatus Protochlamydia amoebophila]